MKQGTVMVVAMAALVASACGASSKEVAMARSAVYQCDEAKVFGEVAAFLKERMGGVTPQPAAKAVVSAFRWHSSTGVPRRKGLANVRQGDLALAVAMTLQRSGNGWMIKSQVQVLSHVVGSPAGRRLNPSDADYPAWAATKHDTLRVKLHDRLKGICPNVSYAK